MLDWIGSSGMIGTQGEMFAVLAPYSLLLEKHLRHWPYRYDHRYRPTEYHRYCHRLIWEMTSPIEYE